MELGLKTWEISKQKWEKKTKSNQVSSSRDSRTLGIWFTFVAWIGELKFGNTPHYWVVLDRSLNMKLVEDLLNIKPPTSNLPSSLATGLEDGKRSLPDPDFAMAVRIDSTECLMISEDFASRCVAQRITPRPGIHWKKLDLGSYGWHMARLRTLRRIETASMQRQQVCSISMCIPYSKWVPHEYGNVWMTQQIPQWSNKMTHSTVQLFVVHRHGLSPPFIDDCRGKPWI
jgi:hypothetical protein